MGGVATTRIPGIEFMVLQNKERAVLLFCFNRQRLEGAISHPGVRILLTKAGYDANSDLDCHLSELRGRVEKGGSFPHEIGLFIGYPAKDVAAFMGLVKLPFRCQALWKIYGRPEKSLNLAENYRRCKNRMGGILNNLNSLDSDGSSRISDFFAHVNDTGCHILMEVQK